MDDTTKTLVETVFAFVQGMFAEASIMLLLAGLVLFLVGLGLLMLSLYIRIKGYRVQGKLLGAISKRRKKEKVTKDGTKKRATGSFTPVFEYRRPDGSLQQTKASEGGSHVTFAHGSLCAH